MKRQPLIVDCSDIDLFNEGHIPDAMWSNDPKIFYNLSREIIVYSYPEENAIDFCSNLVNHTYGNIYYFVGGYSAWKILKQIP